MMSPARTEQDALFMDRALELAERGRRGVRANPMVGAVLVHQGRVVGEGWHRVWGGPHAEVEALADFDARRVAAGLPPLRDLGEHTLYVSLEPCCHHGKTPPCTEALVARHLGRCVVAMVDPDPRVSGQGIQALRNAGCAVETGLREAEARHINRGFVSRLTRGRPWVTLKIATSLDGKIAGADGSSRWITGADARWEARALRDHHDAVLVGAETWIHDKPGLRGHREPGPWRVVVDPRGRALAASGQGVGLGSGAGLGLTLPGGAQGLPTLFLVGPGRGQGAPRPPGCEVVELPPAPGEARASFEPRAILDALEARGIQSVLVEGGGQTLAPFLDQGYADELVTFVAPLILGLEGRPAFPLAGGRELGQARTLPAPVLRCHGADISLTFALGGAPCSRD